jgi:hypothetical protein
VNKYVALTAKCETTIARFRDSIIDVGGLDALLQEYQERYSEISDEAKAFPTTDRDFKVALRSEKLRVDSLSKRYGRQSG